MKVRDVLKALARDGQFIHSLKPGRVSVAGHPSEELDPKTKKSVLKLAGLL
jgi:predicted RNA binding protein YcfA (HicA-like mRNA interferase family)